MRITIATAFEQLYLQNVRLRWTHNAALDALAARIRRAFWVCR